MQRCFILLKYAKSFIGSLLHQTLASASALKEITATMGKGEGVALEADVGFKDIGNKGTFSPHAASHVEETAQVCLSYTYCVVAYVLCCCNPCLNPADPVLSV